MEVQETDGITQALYSSFQKRKSYNPIPSKRIIEKDGGINYETSRPEAIGQGGWTMLTIYPACFYHEEDGWSVIFPDLNDLATEGDTFEDAVEMATDCLAGHVYMEEMLGNKIPRPSSIDQVDPIEVAKRLDPEDEPKECFVNLVSVDVKSYAKEHFEKTVKKTLTIPEWLNDLGNAKNINFSQVLKEALIEKLLK